jgi:Sigma-70, region 4
MIAKQLPSRESSPVVDTFEERHYTLAEIAAMWRISREKARRLFHNEPGVMCFQGLKNNVREYNTYRVPESVARRVRLRLMNI